MKVLIRYQNFGVQTRIHELNGMTASSHQEVMPTQASELSIVLLHEEAHMYLGSYNYLGS